MDFDDRASLAPALAGVTAVLINGTNYGTPADRRGAQHAGMITAAAAAGIPHIVYASWPDPELYPLPGMSDFAESEALLREVSPGATILRTTYGVAQAAARDVTAAIAAGTLAAPAAGARTAPAHIDDLAEAAARVLAGGGPPGHSGPLRTRTLTAADSIGWADLAGLASKRSGRQIAYQAITDDQYTTAVLAQGVPEALAGMLLGIYRACRAGWTSTPTADLATILGRPPRPAISAVAAALAPQAAAERPA